MVYSPLLGPVAEEMEALGIPVVSDLRRLEQAPDIVHGHHHVPTVRALLHFRLARGLFVCHDGLAATDVPPRLGRLRRYVAVDLNCRGRLEGYGIPEERLRVIHNWVDLTRFVARPPLPPTPRRALVFSNYAGFGTHLEAVQAACRELGLPVDVLGAGSGQHTDQPENALGRYDVVFAKARCAIEALAVGTAVVLCDQRGLGPMVTAADMPWLRSWNFGMRLLREPLAVAGIVREVRRYDPDDAQRASRYVREHAGLPAAVAEYLALYREILAEPADPAEAEDDLDTNLSPLLHRLAAFERDLDASHDQWRMESLSSSESEQVRLAVLDPPERMTFGETLFVAVALENRSPRVLSGRLPCPIRFSYRWLAAADKGAPLMPEGLRSELMEAVAPGGRGSCSVRVASPPQRGAQVLRLTVVQERVRWFDELPHPVYVDLNVTVE
jgi:Glycosyltransferase Family 4